ncbi:MAG: ABC transporter permease [Phycisphaerae bacterium]|nr:ABC transporter permease [Phycisphaerae bacterium]
MTPEPPITPDPEPAASSPGPSAWRRFMRHKLGVLGTATLLGMLLACFLSLPFTARRFDSQDLADNLAAPSSRHVLGTDELGRDMLVRVLYGGAISITFGLLAASLSVLIGVTYGAVSAYAGGRVDAVMMRLVDILYSLPYILLVMLLTLSLRPYFQRVFSVQWATFWVLLLAIGGVSWLTMARVVRGQVLSLKAQPFVEAARALGIPAWAILLRHILPNLVGPIVVYATLTVPQAILQESFLSFLGVGVQAPQATWGSLAADGIAAINPLHVHWWLVIWPCGLLAITLLALNFMGDALRDAFDPHRSR